MLGQVPDVCSRYAILSGTCWDACQLPPPAAGGKFATMRLLSSIIRPTASTTLLMLKSEQQVRWPADTVLAVLPQLIVSIT